MIERVRGVDLFYERLGSGDPLLLLNGIMMTTASWALQTRVLATRYECVLHDFRGQLRSGKPDVPWTMADHVDDLALLLDRLGIARAHLVGTSYGGEVGILFALAHPERVRTLSLIACVSHVEPPLREKVLRWCRVAQTDPAELYDTSVPDNYSPAFLEANPLFVVAGRERLGGYPADWFRALAILGEAFLRLDVRAELSRITAPTLVIGAALDRLKPPPYSEELAAAIADARLVMIPDAGHAVVIERPDAVNQALLEFLAER